MYDIRYARALKSTNIYYRILDTPRFTQYCLHMAINKTISHLDESINKKFEPLLTKEEFFSKTDELINEIKALREAIKFHMYGRIT